MKNIGQCFLHPLSRSILSLLVLASLLIPQAVLADDTDEVQTVRFLAEGRYAIVAGGVGMLDSSTGDISLNVPGTAIQAAYLVWSGFDSYDGGDPTLSFARDSVVISPTVTADPVTGTYGPIVWYDDHWYFAYVADVTSLVETGDHIYTVSGFSAALRHRDGAGLMVVYEDPSLPINQVEIKDALDRFYRGWGEGPRAETAVNCFSFAPYATNRQMDITLFVGEIHFGDEMRPNALWYMTGTEQEPMPADMVNTPTDGPIVPGAVELQGPPNDPFSSADGPQWDTYTNTMTIPADDSWACFQVESARYQDLRPASGVWLVTAASLQVQEMADLSVAKADNPDPVVPGEQLVYTLSYANEGLLEAENCVLTDTLPPEVSFVDADPYPDDDTNPLVWNLGSLGAGETGTIAVTVAVQSWVTETFTNTVTVATDTPETDYDNNRADEPTDVTPQADVSIAKSDDPDPVGAGGQLVYTLSYANNGPSDAVNVVVNDLLPPEVTFGDADPYPDDDTNPLVWNLGTLVAGQTGSIMVTVTVGAEVTETFTNTVTIATDTPETDYDNNRAEEPTDVGTPTDLAIAKDDNPDPVVPGEQLAYTLSYANNGTSGAEDVVVTDTLPPEVTFVDADPYPDDDTNPLVWKLGPLAAGGTGTISVTVAVQSWVTETFTNTVVIASETPETDYDNNRADEPTDVTPLADVSIAKSDEPDPAVPGGQLVYTLSYANNGPSDAADVVVTDQLPPEVTFVDADPYPDDDTNPLLWKLGTLVAGQTGTIVVTVTVESDTTETFTNTVTIATDTPETDYDNNQDTETTEITPLADVWVLKDDTPDPVGDGRDLAYSLTYGNHGPSDATDVVITDLLPPEVTFRDAVPSQTSGPNPLIWSLGALPAGQTGTIVVNVSVPADITGTITNTVSISTNTQESNYRNNQDIEPTKVEGSTAVELVYFRATGTGDMVLLEWETAWEEDNWGFRLYRGLTSEFEEAKWIHDEIGQGDSFEGRYYHYVDRDVVPGETYYYWLEDVDTNNNAVQHEPVRVSALYRIYAPMITK